MKLFKKLTSKWDTLYGKFHCRFVHKTHLLVADPELLPPGSWCDLDSRLLYCCFAGLKQFIEKELGFPKGNHEDFNSPRWKEVMELYHWWEAYSESLKNGSYLSKTWDEMSVEGQECTDNLVKLMKIRGILWT